MGKGVEKGLELQAGLEAGVDSSSKKLLDEVNQHRAEGTQSQKKNSTKEGAGAGLEPDLKGLVGSLELCGEVEGKIHDPADRLTEETETVALKEAVDQKKADIEKKYGVTFDTAECLPEQERSRFREPTLAELKTLDNALSKSRESEDGRALSKPLRIAFFKNDPGDGALATHSDIGNGATRIIVRNEDLVPTDGDIKDGKISLGSVLLHELGHRADSVLPRDNERLGWKKAGDDYALESSDGSLYKYVTDDTGKSHWQKVDQDGTSIEGQNDSQVTDEQMQTLAKIKQPMDPANNPCEAFANAIRMYRQSDETRAELAQKSPEVYQYMQDYDREFVRKAGTDFFGTPVNKRNPDFTISKNDAAWNPFLM